MPGADWRLAGCAGLAAGLAVSPLAPAAAGPLETCVALAATVAAAVAAARGGGAAPWALLLAVAAAVLGLLLGTARVSAIDSGALTAPVGSTAQITGTVIAVPRRSRGEVRVEVETPGGKLLLLAAEPVPDLAIGEQVRAEGSLASPPPWLRDGLRRHGIGLVLRSPAIEPTGERRGGIAGRLDEVRRRAERALGESMPAREAALARGFVLGQDDRIDPATIDDFRRSGLAHLLAVSGQNVMLLALLATPLLALLGLPLRARLLWLLGLIAVYVPLAGGGPSIQRAGVMGAAGVLALLAGRPASHAYGLLLAASITLLLNPRASGDIGWQLSFAAVAGIFLLAPPVRDALLARLGRGRLSRGLAEGLAVTFAATMATVPLSAHHFGSLPAGTLPANLIALPAVAPAMWLGMLAAGAGQLPGLPLEPLNALNALLLAYIAQVAAWFGDPGWALVDLSLGSPAAVAAAYVGIAALVAGCLVAERRTRRRAAGRDAVGRRRSWRPAAAGVVLVLVLLVFSGRERGGPVAGRPSPGTLRVRVLDVGQGDAILLQPGAALPVLVDGGPAGAGLEQALREAGVTELAAAILTHDQADHADGLLEIFGRLPVGRLVVGEEAAGVEPAARGAGIPVLTAAQGSVLRSGRLALQVLWPPRELLASPAAADDPNQGSLVLLVRWRNFEMLLTGDAEAEAVPLDPGSVDVLKVAHHGSEDAGLAALLARSRPRLAAISVGEGNPFGHPTQATLRTLRSGGVRVMRTDLSGSIVLDVARTAQVLPG